MENNTNVVLDREIANEIREMVEDVVEDVCRRAQRECGTLVSGETAWKVVSAVALAKEAQFAGLVD